MAGRIGDWKPHERIQEALETYDFSARTPAADLFECVSDKDLNGKHYARLPPADLFSVSANKCNLHHK